MEAQTGIDQPFRFGPFELDVRSRELDNGNRRIRLQEQPFEILRMMLERPGEVVSRDEMQRRLWPDGTFVDFEHSINAAVKRLREALGDDADNPHYVETLPRRGYRFIAALRVVSAEPREGTVPKVRLAVLPFSNLSEERGQDYFADGLTEEMIAQLGHLCRSRIGVISRSSAMVFKESGRPAGEVGRALRADYLLEGSIRREGDRVRITARLVETAGETHLWVESYESRLTDYLSMQKEVAARIANSLTLELIPDAQEWLGGTSSNASAYQAYLKGRYYWNMVGDEGVEQALTLFDHAVSLDPAFASAHAAMSRTRLLHAEYYRTQPRKALEAARQSAKRALDLEPTLYEGHLALGEVRRMLEWDWRGAEAEYSQAIVCNPSHEGAHRGYGLMLAALGRREEAIRESERASEMDPLCCVVISSGAAWVRYLTGDYDAAMARSRSAIALEPAYLAAHRILAAACLCSGRAEEAIDILEKALAVSCDDATLMAGLAHALAVTGNREGAAVLVSRLTQSEGARHVPAYHLALAHVGLGDRDAAFAALEKAIVDADPALPNLAVEPRFEPIRSDARFERLIELIGLT